MIDRPDTFTFHYEISQGEKTFEGDPVVDAVSEERAKEWLEAHLEELYPGEEGYVLLSLECKGSV